MTTTPTPDATEFEARARALLAVYADGMPATVNTEERVRERLAEMAGAPRGQTPMRWRTPTPLRGAGWARGALSLGLVAALILGFVGVTWLRNGFPWGGTRSQCSETRTMTDDGSYTLSRVCPLDKINVQVAVTQSYADTTRTSVEIRVVTPGALIPHGHPISYSPPSSLLLDATLTDQQGRLYTAPIGSLGGPTLLNYASGQEVATGMVVFAPLPNDALTAPQTLTLRISHITAHSTSGWFSPVTGEFTTTFQVTPHAGRSIIFNVAPQTHGGVTLQPLRMDIAPGGSAFDGYGGGGERLILRVSGLHADADAGAVAGISTMFTTSDGSATNTGQTTLKLEGQEPAAIGGIPSDFYQHTTTLVGPSGAVVLEVIFIAPPLRTLTGTQILTVDQTIVSSNGQETLIPGPWTFQLHLG